MQGISVSGPILECLVSVYGAGGRPDSLKLELTVASPFWEGTCGPWGEEYLLVLVRITTAEWGLGKANSVSPTVYHNVEDTHEQLYQAEQSIWTVSDPEARTQSCETASPSRVSHKSQMV